MNDLNKKFRALAGYLLDIYRLASFKFVNPHSSTKFRLINSIKKRTNASVFIETGTYLGVTANRCSSIFEKVYTIELDERLATQAADYLSKHKNVDVIQGDALEVLPTLLESERVNNALIFLDGHFSGGVTACGNLPEPAVEELKMIAKYRSKVKGIVIDDFRLFGTEFGFPKKYDLLKIAEEYFNEYEINVQFDQLIIVQNT